jgi:hypothetical protein
MGIMDDMIGPGNKIQLVSVVTGRDGMRTKCDYDAIKRLSKPEKEQLKAFLKGIL